MELQKVVCLIPDPFAHMPSKQIHLKVAEFLYIGQSLCKNDIYSAI